MFVRERERETENEREKSILANKLLASKNQALAFWQLIAKILATLKRIT